MRFPREFYAQPARDVAVQLLGARLVRRLGPRRHAVGRVVEVEAYVGPHDLACHASHGRTARTEVMFGPPGRAYVYFVYGMHHCVNVVTDPEGYPAAVLLRALEPLEGLEARTSGPGRLCRALAIDRSLNGADLRGDELYLEPGDPPRRVRATARIGVAYAGAWARRRLRFFDADSPHVSRGKS
ncbi:MAG TPA: DNA-3-methyladenine glycosylase [Myxococcales bacterium]|nr:DNA-3-methyladenine glycosylase [Myxococcales bacterium]